MSSKAENTNSDGEQVIRDICQMLPPGYQKKKKTPDLTPKTKMTQGKHLTKSSNRTNLEPSTSKETPKKRGRPRKQVLNMTITDDSHSRTGKKLPQNKREKELATQGKLDDVIEAEMNKDERKQCEEIKEAPQTQQENDINYEDVDKKKQLKRTSKIEKLQQNTESKDKVDQEDGSEMEVKKKRGRPRKTKEQESTINTCEDEPKSKWPRKKKADDGENHDQEDDLPYSNSGYTTKSGRVVNKKKVDSESTCTASTESDTNREGSRNFHDFSTLDEEHKKLYKKHKEKADIWVQALNAGSAKCHWCFMQCRKLKTILRHYDKCNDLYKDGFKCSECGNIFNSPASLSYHKLSSHTETAYGEMHVLKQVLRQKKKITCGNESCTKTFTTIYGYQYHTKRCGDNKVTEIFTCTICEKPYTTDAGLRYHLNTKHAPKEPVVKVARKETEDVGPEDSGKRRRSAAHKAMATMKELKEKGYVEIKDTEKEDKRSTKSRNDFMLFTSPNILIDEEILQKWRALFSSKQRVDCPFDCKFSSVALGALRDHYNACEKNPNAANSERYKCKLCVREYTIKASIISHVRVTHTKDERDKYFTEHNLLESESSESDDDDNDDDENVGDKQEFEGHHDGFITGQSIELYYKWKKENHCKTDQRLFQEYNQQLKNWKLLSESDAAKAEPKCLKSPRFQVRVDDGSVDIETGQDEDETLTLERYAVLSQSTDENVKVSETMFVGGPVWAMAWCPIPVSNISASQYAAISCHQILDSTHKCCTRYEYPGVIQIWNFGCLLRDGNHKTPYLSYGLAHNCGAIWDLKWCPSGCWDDPADTEVGNIPRLGVFAVACSNSTVCLFSVPHQEALSDARNDEKPGFYDVTPTLTLKPASSASDWSMIGQCWCLDWLPCQPHNQIAAGFSNGLIAIWNLTTSSPLLKEEGCNNSISLYPIKIFLAHANQVSGISWCPTDPFFLGSVGYDHKMLFWNLKDVSQPLVLREKQQPLACRWTVHTKGLVTSHDTITGGASVYCQDYGAFCGRRQTIIKKESCMPALDSNNWLDSVVAGDVLGDVRCQALNMGKKSSNCPQYTLPVYRTTIVHLRKKNTNRCDVHTPDENNAEENASQEGTEDELNDVDTHLAKICSPGLASAYDDVALVCSPGLASAYDDVALVCSPGLASAYDDVALVFHDAIKKSENKKNLLDIVKRLHHLDKPTKFEFNKPFLASILRTSWSPNLSSVGWVLTGGQSGLVRAHHVKGIINELVQLQIKKILNQQRKKIDLTKTMPTS